MKALLGTLVALLSALGVLACSQEKASATEIATIDVKGVQCSMCAGTIEEAVGGLEGVRKISVDLKEKKASVEFTPSMLSLASIEKAIAAVGYDANAVPRDAAAHDELPACCQ